MWFTETPWPPIVIFAVAGACCAAAWINRRQAVYLAAIAALVVAGVVTHAVEARIVTERERVEWAIHDLADAFRAKDADRMLEHISANALQWRHVAYGAMNLVTVEDDVTITDLSIEMRNQNSRATAWFRANGTFSVGDFRGHRPTRWEVVWQLEGGRWRIIGVERLDPVRGEPVGIFAEWG
jgi:hypothetical protein